MTHPNTRLDAAQKTLPPKSAQLISNPVHITYLTGFITLLPEEREAVLLYSNTAAILIHGHFSIIPTDNTIPTKTAFIRTQLGAAVARWMQDNAATSLFFDPLDLRFHEWQQLSQELDPTHQLKPGSENPIVALAMQKDAQEIKTIKKSCAITHKVYETALSSLKAGVTEQTIAQLIRDTYRKAGVETLAFPSIIAFGAHSANPHHQPTKKPLESEMPVLIDIGGVHQGYCSDMTRTTWFGTQPTPEFLEAQQAVRTAYDKALAKAQEHHKKTTTAAMVDEAARGYLKSIELGKHFLHTTGHGIGRQVHEQPSISSINTTQLQKNMVITIEPGVYFENVLGYRHENTVLLEKTGAVAL